MKKGWEVKRLGEFIKLEYGKPLPKEMRTENGAYPVYGANGEKARTNRWFYDKKTIIIGRKGSAGEVNITEDKFWPLDVTYFVKFDERKNDVLFLYHTLASLELQKLAKGVKPGINRNEVYSISIPLPPLAEQKRIVAILDEAFAAIDKAKANAAKNLANAKELFESYLNGIFANPGEDWEEKKLGEVCEIKPSKKEARQKLNETDLVSFLPMQDLGVCEREVKPTKEKLLKDVAGSYTYFAEKDVVLAKITPCFENGKVGVVKNLKNGIGFGSSEYIVFRCSDFIVPELLFYYLSREGLRKEGKKNMSGAVGHKRVSKDWVENNLITFPKSQKEQKIIVEKLDDLKLETKRIGEIYQQKIKSLNELKKSILKKAFEGEL